MLLYVRQRSRLGDWFEFEKLEAGGRCQGGRLGNEV